MKELIPQLRESRDFQAIMADVMKQRPVVPEFKPGDTRDATDNMMEKIKYFSAQRVGFDLLYQILTGNKPPQ